VRGMYGYGFYTSTAAVAHVLIRDMFKQVTKVSLRSASTFGSSSLQDNVPLVSM
jgi:hypothetical protein